MNAGVADCALPVLSFVEGLQLFPGSLLLCEHLGARHKRNLSFLLLLQSGNYENMKI